ncbi:hypothetical protein NDU88_001055 [Pleurodeles waltl]|uniref:Uncharacterized protein n=1 Tax=Pleurodeles waltl TaxID=8319 RepID=A0AAV7U9B9_PLEWA|nr:hypothetical protein NDU88_001055 [Pleurodeles waltl]
MPEARQHHLQLALAHHMEKCTAMQIPCQRPPALFAAQPRLQAQAVKQRGSLIGSCSHQRRNCDPRDRALSAAEPRDIAGSWGKYQAAFRSPQDLLRTLRVLIPTLSLRLFLPRRITAKALKGAQFIQALL